MDKKQILEKYKKEEVDEGKDFVNQKGDLAGFIALCLLSIVLMTYQTIKKLPFGDITALLFTFLSVGAFARYKMHKDRTTLFFGIVTLLIAIGSLVYYVYQTI